MSAALFVDANQYLDFFRLVAGKKLLDSLEEQAGYIFLSTQIVDEVLRNKVTVAHSFFLHAFKEPSSITIPDHLLGINDQETNKLRRQAQALRDNLKRLASLASDAITQISLSEDETSKRLQALFARAAAPTADELQRARDRKERGNPPGKQDGPLGDQIIWEQLLPHCKQHNITRLWVIINDRDFYTKHDKLVLLNPLLRRDLIEACGPKIEIHCFTDLLRGLTDFGTNAGVKAEKLPTEKEAAEITTEIDSLLPLDWMNQGIDDSNMAAIRAQLARQNWVATMDGPSGFLNWKIVPAEGSPEDSKG
jgi:hypothetical protein